MKQLVLFSSLVSCLIPWAQPLLCPSLSSVLSLCLPSVPRPCLCLQLCPASGLLLPLPALLIIL